MRTLSTKKIRKVHAEKKASCMRHDELKYIRLKMCLDMKSMALVLNKMPYRTYQDYEYGQRLIPRKVADLVYEKYGEDWLFIEGIPASVDLFLAREFGGTVPNDHVREAGYDNPGER
jgi:hypothetical protein